MDIQKEVDTIVAGFNPTLLDRLDSDRVEQESTHWIREHTEAKDVISMSMVNVLKELGDNQLHNAAVLAAYTKVIVAVVRECSNT